MHIEHFGSWKYSCHNLLSKIIFHPKVAIFTVSKMEFCGCCHSAYNGVIHMVGTTIVDDYAPS